MAETAQEGAAFDPLLDSFEQRYVQPWQACELGRFGSPLDLQPRLWAAAELFALGRNRWRSFSVSALAADAPRAFDGEPWSPEHVEAARAAHYCRPALSEWRELRAPPPGFDAVVAERFGLALPRTVLYASVAMRCATDAAAECYWLSKKVKIAALRHHRTELLTLCATGADGLRRSVALRWYRNDLAALYAADISLWDCCIRAALRALAEEVAETREYIAATLAAGSAALAFMNGEDAEDAQQALAVHAETRKQRAQIAADARSTESKAKMREAPVVYTRLKEAHPKRGKDWIREQVRVELKVSRRTLDRYLAAARRSGILG